MKWTEHAVLRGMTVYLGMACSGQQTSRSPEAGGGTCSQGDAKPLNAPSSYLCPISMDLMSDPVMVATGHTYDRACIERWLDQGNRTCPATGVKLRHLELTPNFALRSAIQVPTWGLWPGIHPSVSCLEVTVCFLMPFSGACPFAMAHTFHLSTSAIIWASFWRT